MAVLTAAAARAGTSNNAVAGQLCDFKQVCPNSCHWCQPCTAADPWPAAILLSSQVVAFYSFEKPCWKSPPRTCAVAAVTALNLTIEEDGCRKRAPRDLKRQTGSGAPGKKDKNCSLG